MARNEQVNRITVRPARVDVIHAVAAADNKVEVVAKAIRARAGGGGRLRCCRCRSRRASGS